MSEKLHIHRQPLAWSSLLADDCVRIDTVRVGQRIPRTLHLRVIDLFSDAISTSPDAKLEGVDDLGGIALF